MDQKRERSLLSGITRNVLVLGIVSLLTDASTEIIYPLLPIFLTEVLKTGTVFVGVVEGIAESTASLFRIFSGWFSDRIARRKMLAVIGYGISSLTRPAVASAMAGWHVLVARFVDRIGKGIRGAPRDALLADSTDRSKWGKAFGFHRSMDHAGAVLGPIIAFLLLMAFPGNYRAVFWFATIPAFLSVLTLAIFAQEKRAATSERRKLSLSLRPFDTRFKLYLIILFIFTLGNSSDAFLLLRAKSLGVSDRMVPVLWAVFHVVKVITSTPGGSLSDRIGRRKVIITGWGIYGLIYLGFAFATDNHHIWLLFLAYGVYYGLTEGTEKALVADLVPSELRGTAYGLFSFAIGVGALPASLILGFLWRVVGPEMAFSFGAGMALLAMILFYSLIRIRSNDIS
jgi:MFS family permease